MGKLYENIIGRDTTNRDSNEKILSAYDKIVEGKMAGWIAMYGGKKFEIKKDQAKDLYNAKQIAIKHFKVPKSKQGLLAIEPAYDDKLEETFKVISVYKIKGFDGSTESMAEFSSKEAAQKWMSWSKQQPNVKKVYLK